MTAQRLTFALIVTISPLSAHWNTSAKAAAPPPPTGPAVPPTTGSITAVPATEPPHSDSSVGEVVVTARKFTERLLDAPLTATVLDSAAIQARDITTLADVANYTPAVTLTNQGGARVDRSSQTIIIRGMNPQSSQTASVFIDGAAIPGGFVEGIDDVQRVEVLKGPQSTAFGREAFAGAIDIVTKDPANTLGGRVDILSATDNTIDARGMIEGPLIKDVLSFRISPRYYSEEGQYTNYGTGPGRLGDQSTRSVNGSLLFTPTSGIKVK